MKLLARIVAVLFLLLAGWLAYSSYLYRAPGNAPPTSIVIERGTGARATLAQLHAAGLLPEPWKIIVPVAVDGEYRSLKAGEYEFEAGLSPSQIIHHIARGQVVVHAVTIPEGFTVAQVRLLLTEEPLLTGSLKTDIAEGSVAPDTVHFQRGDTRDSIVARLQERQQDILQAAWAGRAEGLPFASTGEALTMASIVEEETGVAAERERVAAVYINRLRQGMPLQADPTVAYGVAPGGLERPLTRGDLERDTPYNTYLHPGLPPGPICNPGKAAIEATLHPVESDELFFVATGNGGHYFARTLKEHQANVAKYRAVLRGQ